MMRKTLKIMFLATAIFSAMLATAILVESLSVSTNKAVYNPGDCVIVSGSTTNGGALVSFTVYNPEDSLVALDQVKSGSDGSFTKQIFCFPTEPRSNFPAGSYVIDVKDTDTGEEINVTIQFTGVSAQTNTSTTTTSTQPLNQTVTVTETVYNTTTVTQTILVNNTVVEHSTTTVTQETTVTQTLTSTVTATQTETQTETVTSTVTTTMEKTNAAATAGAAVVALIVGLGAALALKRG